MSENYSIFQYFFYCHEFFGSLKIVLLTSYDVFYQLNVCFLNRKTNIPLIPFYLLKNQILKDIYVSIYILDSRN